MKKASSDRAAPSSSETTSNHRGFIQNRLQNFGLTMVVMGASFGLYYLGFFGGIEGPLSPERIGDALANLGVSDRHLLILCLSLAVVSLTWNWVYYAFRRFRSGRTFGAGERLRVIRKGTPGHFMWMMFLVFSIIVFCYM